MKKPYLLTGVLALALSSVKPALTLAETDAASSNQSDTLQEVIVTAERRSVDVQKVALSVSVIDGDALAQHGDSTMAQALQDVPGVVVQGGVASPIGGAGGPPNIAVRGIGTDGPNRNGSTSIYEDGVLIVGGGANFFDLSRIEVLRGPQGTLYGRGATAGAVNIVTNDPTQTFGGTGQATIGTYGLFGSQGALNMPLSDDVAARFSFNTVRHDGYFSSGGSNEADVSARAKVLIKPSEDFSLLLGGVYYRADQNAASTVNVTAADPQPSDWTPSTTIAGHDVIAFNEGYANLQLNLGFANLTYIPAYQATHSTQNNSDGTTSQMPWNHTFTQELRLSSPNESKVLWTAGGYYFNSNFFQNFGIPGAFYFNQAYASSAAAVFGEATFPVSDDTRLTGGVRESRDTVHHANISSFPRGTAGVDNFVDAFTDVLNKTYNRFDWKVRAEHDLSAQSLLYGMVSTGYRPGGSVNGLAYDPEHVTAYEVGSKNRIGSRFILNGAVYYYNYGGFQAPESCCGPQVQSIMTSLPAKFIGAELEGTALLSAADRLTFSANFLHARYGADALPNALFPQAYSDGNPIPHAPDFSVSGSFAHTFNFSGGATLVPQVDGHYQTKIYTDFDPSLYPAPGIAQDPSFVQKAYTIANASITYTSASGNYHITVYDNNLSDVIYKTTVNGGMGGPDTAGVNDPRTFGLLVGARF